MEVPPWFLQLRGPLQVQLGERRTPIVSSHAGELLLLCDGAASLLQDLSTSLLNTPLTGRPEEMLSFNNTLIKASGGLCVCVCLAFLANCLPLVAQIVSDFFNETSAPLRMIWLQILWQSSLAKVTAGSMSLEALSEVTVSFLCAGALSLTCQ